MRRLSQSLAYLAVRSFICVVQASRVETCHAACRFLAFLCTRVIPLRRRVVDENLRLAYPALDDAQRRALAHEMWEHLFLVVVEVAIAQRKIHQCNWRRYMRLVEPQLLMRCLLDERPLVLVGGHYGNFEMAGYMLGLLGFPTYSVARPLENPRLNRFLNQFRGATGQYIIDKVGGYPQILSVLADGGTMAFLADQYAGTKGCWVEFFGQPASTHKAIALLALEHQTLLAVGCARRRGAPLHFELEIDAALDVRDDQPETSGVRPLTQWYTRRIETMVRRAPEQYWWVHRRWKDRRPEKRRRKAA